ncbi:flagellar motor protein MotB [Legionella fallonii]|uniref:Putative flagellar motor protein MotD n=1 Tax=Legionella fallonii LLAP-10 TaxID=1212491 RepID=A0A098G3C7_9GAMM|nr:OmpA family protein [Legionella fallonii]CEG56481.1 putative flagellar motor protein MotD [Legionella fallonii LLAP-10]
MRSRRNKQEEHIDSHRWVVSYADFITLLFAFFVVMYAISSVNVSKYRSLSDGMKSAFNKKDQNKATESTDKKADGPNDKKTSGKYRDGLDDLNKSLSELESGDFKISRQEGWIEMDIKAGSMFANGTADLTPEALVKLMQLAAKVKDLPYPIVVEGYTDDVPIETPQFPSNWELSATRAATVARILNSYGISNDRLLVTGYGDQYPIADNSTEEGRSQNRRVDIIIAKNRGVDRLTNPEMGQPHNVMFNVGPAVDPIVVPKAATNQQDPVKKENK